MSEKRQMVVLDATHLHDRVVEAFEEEGITPWPATTKSIVENILYSVMTENRYHGERNLERYLIRKGFGETYKTVQLTRTLHELADKEYFSSFRLLFSTVDFVYDSSTHALLIICSDDRMKPAVAPCRYPDEGDEVDEKNVPYRIRQLLDSLKK